MASAHTERARNAMAVLKSICGIGKKTRRNRNAHIPIGRFFHEQNTTHIATSHTR